METMIENFGIEMSNGRSATVIVERNCYVTIAFSRDRKGNPTIIAENSTLLTKALSEIKERYPDYEPKCLLYQAPDWVMYQFKRIL